ncbi:MAG: pyridoxal phosphate-dependent class II aminotransferase [Rhodobacteraceae bacterium]|nr:pyridoxal phosphate-dependent class II aminotransferase [Paracoccaceae bacterium]
MNQASRDHGGGLDAAVTQFGGQRADWLDLSTGINPVPYPVPEIPQHFWNDLPDKAAQTALLDAARDFWQVPIEAGILAASGVSALIAQLPRLAPTATVGITRPTYNEHEAAFRTFGWKITETGSANIFVHPNNPDGRLFTADRIRANHRELTIIDESFCDISSDQSLIELALTPGIVILKGLGKFWGLAGLRLGFAIALPDTIERLNDMLGPWAISGPAQHIGTAALRDHSWAHETRKRLARDAERLDQTLAPYTSAPANGTDLFRLYSVKDAAHFQNTLARHHIWSRVFPYSKNLLRLGLPATDGDWNRLTSAVHEV